MKRNQDGQRYHAVRARMHELFPGVFTARGARPVPLKQGIHDDILDDPRHGFGRGRVRWFLRCWTYRAEYLEVLAAGGYRYGLDGQPVEPISDEAQALAGRILADRIAALADRIAALEAA